MSTAASRSNAIADRRLTEHGRERKQQLIDAAAELFAANGYAATRIQDICDRAGVAKGLFYWYFPTKQDLFAELVRTMRTRLRKAQAAAMDDAADPLTRLRQGTEASVRFHTEHAGYFALLDVERADAAHAALLREGSAVYLADVVMLVRAAQDAGRVAPDAPPDALAVGVLGAVSSFTHAWRDDRLDMDSETLATFVGAWVERALSGR
jgi:AcrR family transcriptional regulator